jgi:hypothetical protein
VANRDDARHAIFARKPAEGKPDDAKAEPMGALGDMAWYSMRAVVEYLRPQGQITKVVTVAVRDPETTTVVRASGLIAFDAGEVSSHLSFKFAASGFLKVSVGNPGSPFAYGSLVKELRHPAEMRPSGRPC